MSNIAKLESVLMAVTKINQWATQRLEVDKFLQNIVEVMQTNFGLSQAQIYGVDENQNRLILRARAGETTTLDDPVVSFHDHHPFAQVAHTKEPLLITSSEATDFRLPTTASQLILPLLTNQNHLLGLLDLQAETSHHFTPIEHQIQSSLALQIATTLQNLTLHDQAQHALIETERLYQASADLNTSQTYDDILTVFRQYTIASQAQSVSLGYFNRPVAVNESLPEYIDILARWASVNRETFQTRYHLADYYSFHYLVRSELVYIPDITDPEHFEKLDPGIAAICHQAKLKTVIYAPIIVAGQWVGFLNLLYQQKKSFSTVEFQRLLVLTNQVAVAVQNLYNLNLAEQQRANAELLYDFSAKLNATTTLNELVETVAQLEIHPEVRGVGLYTLELDTTDQPVWAKLVAAWVKTGESTSIGRRYYLPDFPTVNTWLEKPFEPLIISDTQDETQVLGETGRAMFTRVGSRTVVYLPLYIHHRWVGLLNLDWADKQQFSERDRLLYRSIIAQTAAIVENRLLFEQTQQRAAQLERLTQVEMALSQASTEAEIISAVALAFGSTSFSDRLVADASVRLALHYISLGETNQPAVSQIVAVWQHGQVKTADSLLKQKLYVQDYTAAQLWFQSPNEIIIIPDVKTDPNLDDNTRQILLHLQASTTIIIPLYSGDRWQGLLFCSWSEPHPITPAEQFILKQLLEPIAAVVASRRAYLAEQDARQEIERRVWREQTIQEITGRMRQATNLKELVQFTTQELGRHFGAEYVRIELGADVDQ